jgi:chemotaxis protein CheD
MSESQQRELIIGVGEQMISRDNSAVFALKRLTSAVVLVLRDKESGLTGVSHVSLPGKVSMAGDVDEESTKPLQYADQAIPTLLNEMSAQVKSLNNLQASLIGGSQLFNFGGGASALNIGSRNVQAIKTQLAKEGIAVSREDTGGNRARNITVTVVDGVIQITPLGKPTYTLE